MKRILIADPNTHTRQAFTLLLERRLGARDVREAWDHQSLECALAVAVPDVLILDCHLPGVPAPEIALLARRLTGVRLALMSVDAGDVTTAHMLNVAFIYKGALPEEVLATLNGLIPA